MTPLMDLWLPILVSAVVVFFASFVAWMVLPHHKPDFQNLRDEGSFLKMMKDAGIGPGVYLFPGCDPKSLKTEEGKARYQTGPWGVLMMHKGPAKFGRNLALVLGFYLVVGVFVAYLSHLARAPGADFMGVMRVAGTAGIAAYCLGGIPHGLFFGRTPRAMAVDCLDGIVFGVLTGVVFAWLWPGAAQVV